MRPLPEFVLCPHVHVGWNVTMLRICMCANTYIWTDIWACLELVPLSICAFVPKYNNSCVCLWGTMFGTCTCVETCIYTNIWPHLALAYVWTRAQVPTCCKASIFVSVWTYKNVPTWEHYQNCKSVNEHIHQHVTLPRTCVHVSIFICDRSCIYNDIAEC